MNFYFYFKKIINIKLENIYRKWKIYPLPLFSS